MENKTNFEWAEMFQEQIQNGASQSDILQMLEEYKDQVLRIHDVVWRSEQLVCSCGSRLVKTTGDYHCVNAKCSV